MGPSPQARGRAPPCPGRKFWATSSLSSRNRPNGARRCAEPGRLQSRCSLSAPGCPSNLSRCGRAQITRMGISRAAGHFRNSSSSRNCGGGSIPHRAPHLRCWSKFKSLMLHCFLFVNRRLRARICQSFVPCCNCTGEPYGAC